MLKSILTLNPLIISIAHRAWERKSFLIFWISVLVHGGQGQSLDRSGLMQVYVVNVYLISSQAKVYFVPATSFRSQSMFDQLGMKFLLIIFLLCSFIISTMQHHAIQCNTMQYHAIPCSTMQYHAMPCSTMQYHAIPCNTMQYHAIQCNTMHN